jgi:hypothetical protein
VLFGLCGVHGKSMTGSLRIYPAKLCPVAPWETRLAAIVQLFSLEFYSLTHIMQVAVLPLLLKYLYASSACDACD